MRKNKIPIVTGLGSAILDADMHVETKGNAPLPTVTWEEASEEVRNDPNISWISMPITGNKFFYRKYTKEEKKQLFTYNQQRLLNMFDYILNKYGWEYAEGFYNTRRNDFKKYNVEIDLKIPHCKYNKDNQCDITCAFFNGRCCYD